MTDAGAARRSPRLSDRAAAVEAALLDYPHTELPEPQRTWLRERYAEVVPAVVRDALVAVDDNTSVPPECLDLIRTVAARRSQEEIPFGIALRGAFPALRVLAPFLRELNPRDAVTLMYRAALVAQELGSAWVEGWLQASRADRVGVEGVAGAMVEAAIDIEAAEQLMLAMVADGRSNAEIADQTNYSRQAVGWHLSRIMRRWKVPNRSALVASAFARGVLKVGHRSPGAGHPADRATPGTG